MIMTMICGVVMLMSTVMRMEVVMWSWIRGFRNRLRLRI